LFLFFEAFRFSCPYYYNQRAKAVFDFFENIKLLQNKRLGDKNSNKLMYFWF